MPEGQIITPPQPVSHKGIYIAGAVAVVVVLAALGYFAYQMRTGALPAPAAATTQTDSNSAAVDANATVNAVDAANPFNEATSTTSTSNDYQNPFQ